MLPVFNGEIFIKQAIESILSQTYEKFELIIIDDGSKDGSAAIIREISDKRIFYYYQSNQGLVATLNRGIALSRGEYIARQDQDDLAYPKRFERQICFLENNSNYGMVGTWANIIQGTKMTERVHKHSSESIYLKFGLLLGNPFVHSSMMIRRKVFEDVGLYSTDKTRQPPEDYELWSRIARKYEIANIPEILQGYREVPSSMCRTEMQSYIEKEFIIMVENIAILLNRTKSDKNICDLAALACSAYHKLSCNVNYTEIKRLVYEAADKLSELNGVSSKILRVRIPYHLRRIHNQYIKYKFGAKVAKIFSIWNKLVYSRQEQRN